MSVVQVITKARGSAGQADSDGRFRYTINLQAITNDTADGPQTVAAGLGFAPFDQYGFGHDDDPECHAKSIDIRRSTDSPYIWDVTVEYDSEVQDWDENPLARPTVIDYSFSKYQEVYWQDVNNNPVVNAAGIYFDPPIERDQSRLLITMTRNELVFPLANALAYQDATNSDAWFGCAIGTCKMNNITGKFTKEAGISFYECVYEVEVRYEGWQHKILNQGLTQAGGQPCTEEDGTTAVSEPVPLSATGAQLAWPVDPTLINFVTRTPYRSLPFAALALP